MSQQRTSLIIRSRATGPTTGGPGRESNIGSGGSSGNGGDDCDGGFGGHVVRIRLEGNGTASESTTSGVPQAPVVARLPRPDSQCTVYISTDEKSVASPSVAASKTKKSATVYLSSPSEREGAGEENRHPRQRHNRINDDHQIGCNSKTSSSLAEEAMLIKPEEFFFSGRTSGSAASEAADSGTCSDLDNTTPPPDHRHSPSDEDISSDSLSDQEPNYTSPYPPNKDKDDYLVFHLNEKDFDKTPQRILSDEESFAGQRSFEGEASAIRSSRGTIRGVKNRVRAGIATFLTLNNTKTWQEKEAGSVVVYTTTMGIVRETFQRCLKVRHILRTNLVKYTEKDVFMSKDVQTELRDRMSQSYVELPQVFIEGLHIGDADTVEKLNESGELRKMLKSYRSMDACTTCQICGDYRLLPCNVCNGSKKSVHRNPFSTELVALKCMHCDEVGLIKCYAC